MTELHFMSVFLCDWSLPQTQVGHKLNSQTEEVHLHLSQLISKLKIFVFAPLELELISLVPPAGRTNDYISKMELHTALHVVELVVLQKKTLQSHVFLCEKHKLKFVLVLWEQFSGLAFSVSSQ